MPEDEITVDVPGAGDVTTTPTAGGDAVLGEIQTRLLAQSGAVSSADSEIEKTIQAAIAKTEAGTEAGKRAISIAGERQITSAEERGVRAVTSFRESTRGFAVNTAAMRQLTESTNKEVKDLEDRRQELLLTADAQGAAAVSGLILQKLTFQQESKQRTFNNLLSIGTFTRAGEAQKLQQRQVSFQEEAAKSNLALQFGLEVREDDTLETITARAAPFASERQKLEIDRIRTDIRRAEAETAKALQGVDFKLDDTTASVFASTVTELSKTNPAQAEALLASIDDQYGADGFELVKRNQLAITAERFKDENLRVEIQDQFNDGASLGTVIDGINDDFSSTPEQKARAIDVANELKPEVAAAPFVGGILGEVLAQQERGEATGGIVGGLIGRFFGR